MEDRNKNDSKMRVKQSAAAPPNGDPLVYTMSDGSVDRMGDVIEPDGWRLDNFRANPVALFSHDAQFPIGRWRDVGVRNGRLIGHLELIEAVSDRLREIHAAVKAGVLRAVSVGFHAHKYEPLEGSKNGGLHFLEQELVECSLVSVPANPNALATVKALGISREGAALIFGGIAETDQTPAARANGGIARTNLIPKATAMQTSELISNGQADLNNLREELRGIDANDVTKVTDVTGRIEDLQQRLEAWHRAERALAVDSEIVARPGRQLVPQPAASAPPPRPWAMPKQKDPEPGYLFLRHLVAIVGAHHHPQGKSAEQVLVERYGHYGDFEVTKELHNWYMRAATTPATLTGSGWADTLAQTMYGDFLDTLMPMGIYSQLAPRGFRVNLARNATVSIPTRSATPTVAGAFVAEGAPIPVKQAAFAPVTMGLKKLGVISTYTREIWQHSTPNIEGILRDAMQEDTQVTVDTALIDATAASSIRPAGLRAGVSGLTPTAGGGFNALVADIKALTGALAAVNGLRAPVWIMNDQQVNSIRLTQNAGGNFAFNEVTGGTLLGYPVIKSTTQTLGTVILVAAEEFMSLSGDQPDFNVSDVATLHMEDTNPLQIATGVQGSGVLATPTRSMFQTDSIALRMILPLNWVMRRTGMVAWVAAVTW